MTATSVSSIAADLSLLNLTELTPLSPEVIQRQATVNIGTIGHVAHGKSTVVKAISGVQVQEWKNRMQQSLKIIFADCSLQKWTWTQHHHQAWIC